MLYRLRKRLNGVRFWAAARGVHRTPPTPCDPAADCTIHTMLGRADFLMYLVAVKSFLRFRPPARVFAHSDGSLTRGDESILRRHVPGIRIVTAGEADARAADALRDEPFLAKWRAHDPCYRRLIDTEIWCETPRRIIIDSDILVLNPPEQAMKWMASGTGALSFWAAGGNDGPLPISPGGPSKQVQPAFRENLAGIAAAVGRPAVFYQGGTGGFYGCSRELSLPAIADVIRAASRLGVPMGQWGGDQCVSVYLLSAAGAEKLDPAKYVNFSPGSEGTMGGVAVAHFYGTHRYHAGVYPRLAAAAVRDLLATPT